MSERTRLASLSASTVIAAEGLLADFNDAGVLDPLDTLAASTIARLRGETDDAAILAAALAVRGTRHGHVCVGVADLRQAVVVDGQDPDVVDSLPWPDAASWQETLEASALVGDGSGDEPLVIVDGRLYVERYFRYEQQVARLIMSRVEASGRRLAPASQEMLDRLLAPSGQATTQHLAATTALGGRVAVIAGGPGTGKTYTIGAILVALAAGEADAFPMVALCAPTGKAAARLGEAIGELAAATGDPAIVDTVAAVAPSTIHRLLGWAWGRGRFERDATNRLPHDLVIVDEMSMVSLPLAAKLLAAVRDDATVVMVGDPFQLESIEAGTVLADIVGPAADTGQAPAVPLADRVVILDRVHRFEDDGTIGEFADAIRHGDADAALDLLVGDNAANRIGWVSGPGAARFGELWEQVVASRRRLVEAARSGEVDEALGGLNEIAVLCARRQGPGSVAQWSRDIELALDEHFPGLRWDSEWYPGRPVIITRNDYNLDLYNGDIGVVVDTGDGLRAVFERGDIRQFPLSHLTEHSTVHALTIHKSQGSQFDQVVVVLPDEASRLLTRELLYTAVTRARQRVWVVGSEAVIRQAVSRSVQRASGLGSLLC